MAAFSDVISISIMKLILLKQGFINIKIRFN